MKKILLLPMLMTVFAFSQPVERVIDGEIKSIDKIYYKYDSLNELKELVEKGNDKAKMELAYAYLKGDIVKRDIDKAIDLYKDNFQFENDGLLILGKNYLTGNLFKQDYKKAFYYYSKTFDNAVAYYYLGQFYFNGIGVDKDYQKAIKHYVFDTKTIKSKVILGDIYSKGIGTDIDIDIDKAFLYYKKGISFKYNETKTLNLAKKRFSDFCKNRVEFCKKKELYKETSKETVKFIVINKNNNKKLTDKEYKKIFEKFIKKVYPDNHPEYKDIAYNLQSVPEYSKYFMDFLIKEANKGDSYSQMMAGASYEYDKDLENAIKYHKMAANQKNISSQIALALIYENKKNKVESLKYYKMAAKQDSPLALFYVGNKYLQEEKDKETTTTGLLYLKKASIIGSDRAGLLISIYCRIAKKDKKALEKINSSRIPSDFCENIQMKPGRLMD